MRQSSTLALTLGLAAGAATAINLGDGNSPYHPVKLGIQKKHHDGSKIRRRSDSTDDTVQVTLDNFQRSKYFADGSVGDPPQKVAVQIDTGSSDLWVNTKKSSFCASGKCDQDGTYNANDSSTYSYINSAFSISYVDGSGAKGDYVKDKAEFADITVDNLQMGVAYKSSSVSGILGIGFTDNEAQVQRLNRPSYPNFSQRLVDDKVTATNAFSLYLNDLDADTGNILFGGVDTAKFHGKLVTVPMVASDDGVIREVRIKLTSVGLDGDNSAITKDASIGVVLDSGAAISYMPPPIANAIFDAAGAVQIDPQSPLMAVDCEISKGAHTIDFEFDSKVTIQVPIDEMVINFGHNQCVLGISAAPDPSSVILGDTFLRSAYVVYDLSNKEISLAQTNFNATESKIVAIQAGSSGAPDATGTSQDDADFALGTTVPMKAVGAGVALVVAGMALMGF